MVMRGGTSKGAYFVADEMPEDVGERDALLARLMGSPDPRQIDGIGGAHPLTSKVAVVSPSDAPGVDVDYLFLQVGVDDGLVSDRQNCGNVLAGVGQFALERGLIQLEQVQLRDSGQLSGSGSAVGESELARVHIRMVNGDSGGEVSSGAAAAGTASEGRGSVATATFPVAGGMPCYEGETAISGVPGTAAEVRLDFEGTAGSACGALLPTGAVADVIDGVEATCIDNGMPTVVLRAADLGIDGDEAPGVLEVNEALRERLEAIRLLAGKLMTLGDVSQTTVPKMTLVSAPRGRGHICTRTFIPHRCHDAIGVLGAVSVATALRLPGAVGSELLRTGDDPDLVEIEHPTGTFAARVEIARPTGIFPARVEIEESTGARAVGAGSDDGPAVPTVGRSGIVRTARKLFDGIVFPKETPR